MHILQAIFLGIIQGLTEFIPISSSGHLILVEKLFHFETGGLVFDVMLHLGTLVALLVYFWRDILKIIQQMFMRGGSNIGWYIGLATIPGVIAGVLLESLAETTFRSIGLVAVNLAVAGAIMLWADRSKGARSLKDLKAPNALIIGVAQAIALIPGVSRSGITIIAGRFQGFSRQSAARFAFLMAIPITAGAIAKQIFSSHLSEVTAQGGVFAAGMLSAGIVGFLSIKYLLRYLANHSLAVFAYYRFVLAAIILITILI